MTHYLGALTVIGGIAALAVVTWPVGTIIIVAGAAWLWCKS